MAIPTCPKCRKVIGGDDVNVARDVAFCRACGLLNSLSAMVHAAELDPHVDPRLPPAGAWHRDDGVGTATGATHRSLGAALGALAIALFWNGIVSIFVLLALGATLKHLGVTLPEWFPAPDMNGEPMGVGMTIFLWIFLTPFIAIGTAMVGFLLMALFGKTELRLFNGHGTVHQGIGRLGYSRRFEVDAVVDVRLEEKTSRDSDGDRSRTVQVVIELKDGRLIRFGSSLREDRKKFLASMARKLLVEG